MTRKKAGGLMFDEAIARFASSLRIDRSVVLPQRFSGDSIPMYVVTSRRWKAYVWTIQSARVSDAHLGRMTKRLSKSTSRLSSSFKFTGSGHGEGSGTMKGSDGVLECSSGVSVVPFSV